MPWTVGRARRYFRLREAPGFDFQDEFLIADANPLTNPRLCEPGPGRFTVVDLDARLSVNFGALQATLAGAAYDRTVLHSTVPFARRAGRFLEAQWTAANNSQMRVGWNKATGGLVADNCAVISLVAAPNIQVREFTTDVAVNYPYVTLSDSYVFRIYDTGDGFLFYFRIQPSTTWRPLWLMELTESRLQTIYPAWNNLGQQGTMQFFRIKSGRPILPSVYLPNPGQNTIYNSGVAAGSADGLFDVTFTVPSSGAPGLVFRRTDVSNYWGLRYNVTGGTIQLYKVVAGVTTSIGTTTVTLAAGTPVRLRAVCIGNHIRSFLGLQAGPSTTDAFNNGAVLCGTQADATYLSFRCYPARTLPD